MKKELAKFEDWPFRVPNWKKVGEKIDSLTDQFVGAKDEKGALKAFKAMSRYMEKVEDQLTHISVLFTLDTRNPKYVKANAEMDENSPVLAAKNLRFAKALLESPYRPFLEKKLGSFLFQMYEYSLKGFDERIVEDSVEENRLTSEYGSTIAHAEVPFRGEVYNLPQMGKFMVDQDRETRKEASEAYYAYLSTIRPKLEDIYDRLVHVRDRMAKKLGYKSYVELAYVKMNRFDYTPEEVAAYRESIHDYVTPLAEKLFRAQAKRIGIRNMRVYDLNVQFPDGNPLPRGTTEEKVEAAKVMYKALSPETDHYFNFMVDHHLLFLDAKPGKQSGGYMTYFPVEKTPIIFSNFNGTSGDVDVLTHEFGHSFQAYLAGDIKIPEYRMPTMESCEIDSMSMEFFAEPYMDLFFAEPVKYRYLHLADSISFLPYGVTVDEFQHWVYENPDATKEERNAKWHELELKYTPWKVKAYEGCPYMMEGGRWLTQSHIFNSPFYYIDYTLAQVIAFQFFNLDRKDHEKAWKKYLRLCKMGGKYPFRTLLKKAGLKDPFVDGTLKRTIQPLKKVLKDYGI